MKEEQDAGNYYWKWEWFRRYWRKSWKYVIQEVNHEKKRAVNNAEDNVQHSKEKEDCRFKKEEKQLVTDEGSMKRRWNF